MLARCFLILRLHLELFLSLLRLLVEFSCSCMTEEHRFLLFVPRGFLQPAVHFMSHPQGKALALVFVLYNIVYITTVTLYYLFQSQLVRSNSSHRSFQSWVGVGAGTGVTQSYKHLEVKIIDSTLGSISHKCTEMKIRNLIPKCVRERLITKMTV